jgi:hypothetical protein
MSERAAEPRAGQYHWSDRCPAIAEAAAHVTMHSFIIDGEAVVVGPDELSRFDSAAITADDHQSPFQPKIAPTREHLASHQRAPAPTLAARTLAPRCELASPIKLSTAALALARSSAPSPQMH